MWDELFMCVTWLIRTCGMSWQICMEIQMDSNPCGSNPRSAESLSLTARPLVYIRLVQDGIPTLVTYTDAYRYTQLMCVCERVYVKVCVSVSLNVICVCVKSASCRCTQVLCMCMYVCVCVWMCVDLMSVCAWVYLHTFYIHRVKTSDKIDFSW